MPDKRIRNLQKKTSQKEVQGSKRGRGGEGGTGKTENRN